MGKDFMKKENYEIYSVQIAPDYNDDIFLSEDLDDCVRFIDDNDYRLGVDCRITKLLCTFDGIVLSELEHIERI